MCSQSWRALLKNPENFATQQEILEALWGPSDLARNDAKNDDCGLYCYEASSCPHRGGVDKTGEARWCWPLVLPADELGKMATKLDATGQVWSVPRPNAAFVGKRLQRNAADFLLGSS